MVIVLIDFDSNSISCEDLPQLKPKAVLDAIAVCLNNKADFSSEVVREALRLLLVDEVPALPLMRTAILAGQAFADVKRFVLSDVVPALVRKRVWVVAPKVWDGVLFAVKNFTAASAFKNSEHTLTVLLGLPAQQLRAVIKAAPNVVQPMARMLNAFSSEEERALVVSGGSVGEIAPSGSGSGVEQTSAGVAVDADKARIIEEILSAAALPAK